MKTAPKNERSKRRVSKGRVRSDDFIGIVAHELKTPITILKLNIQLLAEKLKGKDRERSDLVRDMKHEIELLTNLIDDLLTMNTITAGTFTIDKRAFDIGQLLKQVIHDIGTRARSISLESRSLKVHADPDRIRQVITNLVENAVKYAPGRLEVKVRSSNKKALVEVRDHGPGIPRNAHSRIFQSRYRLPVSGRPSGLGLGLYICHTIIRSHGERIWVESDPKKKGSSFYFTLPLA